MKTRRRILRWYAPVMFAATIILLMSLPTPPSSRALPASDKVQHAAVFGALGVLTAMAIQRPARSLTTSQAVVAIFITTAFGVLTELQQYFLISGRFGCTGDVLADFMGATFAVSVYYMVARRWPRISLILGQE